MLERDIKDLEESIREYAPIEHLEQEYLALKREVKNIKVMHNLSDSSDDESLSDMPEVDDIKSEVKDEEDDFSSSDEENENDDDEN